MAATKVYPHLIINMNLSYLITKIRQN